MKPPVFIIVHPGPKWKHSDEAAVRCAPGGSWWWRHPEAKAVAKSYNLCMLYDGTKDLLKNIVEWLEGSDESDWEGRTAFAVQCISDMRLMAQPLRRNDKPVSFAEEMPVESPVAGKLSKAIPHAKAMLRSMRSRNRAAALQSGKATLAAM